VAHLSSRRDSRILRAGVLFLLIAVLVSLGRGWLHRETAPAPRPHSLFRTALPGVDVGADAWPAGPGQAGYVELWIARHDADDIQILFRLIGSPALPRPYAPWQYILTDWAGSPSSNGL